MHRDVIDIRYGADTLTLSRFAALAENGRERGPSEGVDRALRLARHDPFAMAELRSFLTLHALLPFGYILTDDEVLRITEAAIVSGALDARLSVDEKQYRPTGPPQAAPPSPSSVAAPPPGRYQKRPEKNPAPAPASAFDKAKSRQITQALADAKKMLEKAKADLAKWDNTTQTRFKRWFGATDEAARKRMSERVDKEIAQIDKMTVANFQPAEPGEEDCYAYVYPNDDTKVYLGDDFAPAPATGPDSKAGTLVHEMSHYDTVGGTEDHAYGQGPCKALAKQDPPKAQSNADSFEYFVEGE
jgi:hypothetical protein